MPIAENYTHSYATTSKYYPYGGCRNSTGDLGTDKLFTGQRLDSTGLYYYNARYYDATIGRFISADSIVPNPANPQALNRYSYCLNNPLKYIDPSGHQYEPNVDPASLPTGSLSWSSEGGWAITIDGVVVPLADVGVPGLISDFVESKYQTWLDFFNAGNLMLGIRGEIVPTRVGDYLLYPEARYNYEKGTNEYIISAIKVEDWNFTWRTIADALRTTAKGLETSGAVITNIPPEYFTAGAVALGIETGGVGFVLALSAYGICGFGPGFLNTIANWVELLD